MEYFVGAEELMLCIEEWQLQGIDDTANGVDDARPTAATGTQALTGS